MGLLGKHHSLTRSLSNRLRKGVTMHIYILRGDCLDQTGNGLDTFYRMTQFRVDVCFTRLS